MLPYYLLRVLLAILTYLAAQTTTHRMTDLEAKMRGAGFQVVDRSSYLLDSLLLLVGEKEGRAAGPAPSPLLYPTVRLGSRARLVEETFFPVGQVSHIAVTHSRWATQP